MKTDPEKVSKERGGGDTPVIIVALSAVTLVIVFVVVVLYWLPNWKLKKTLTAEETRISALVTAKNEALGDAASLALSVAQILDEEKKLAEAYSEGAQREPLKGRLTDVFLEEKFKLENFFFGAAMPGEDPLWLAAPVEFRMIGPKDRLQKAVAKWRGILPITARLLEVDVKKHGTPKSVDANFMVQALFLAPLGRMAEGTPAQVVTSTLPPVRYFENMSNRTRREHIDLLAKQVSALETQLGEANHLEAQQKRLEEVLSRRADFTAEREREFDLLERQLKDILPKLNQVENHRIILKVKETLVEKERAPK